MATCNLLGVSTRQTDKLVETLGITRLAKSQVSVIAMELDTAVDAFRTNLMAVTPKASSWLPGMPRLWVDP